MFFRISFLQSLNVWEYQQWSRDSVTDARGLRMEITTTDFVCALSLCLAAMSQPLTIHYNHHHLHLKPLQAFNYHQQN